MVTGGCGFIGSHLVERLVELGCEVLVVDIARRHVIEGVEYYNIDIRNMRDLEEVFKHGVDGVFHLAALIDVEDSIRRPCLYHEVNVSGTLNLLELVRKYDVGKFIFMSSAAVYGNPKYLPIDENHPLCPLSPYGASKVACESYIHAYFNAYGVNSIIFRLFNAYGPRQTSAYAGVISIFIRRALRGEPLIVFGDGNQTRDFIYVGDVVEALVKGLFSNVRFGIYNLGTGRATSVNDLAKLVLEVVGRKVPIVHDNPRPGDIRYSYACIDKIRGELNWEPRVSLREGLVKTVEWFKTNLD